MFTVAAKVDKGIYEKNNDDRALIGNIIISDSKLSSKINETYLMSAVCDGVGGMQDGYKAASITLELLHFLHRSNVGIQNIHRVIEECNRRVLDLHKKENMKLGSRTTVAGIYTDNNRFYVFNAGDSRVYRFRYKYLQQLSKDHSWVQDMVDVGALSVEDARKHPKRNIINKCIGDDNEIVPRIVDCTDDFFDNDIVMICSDGITDVVTDTEIKEILIQYKSDEFLEECCDEIYNTAIRNGSSDNISIILIRKEGE